MGWVSWGGPGIGGPSLWPFEPFSIPHQDREAPIGAADAYLTEPIQRTSFRQAVKCSNLFTPWVSGLVNPSNKFGFKMFVLTQLSSVQIDWCGQVAFISGFLT